MTPNRRRFLHFFDPVCTENSYPVLPRAAPTTPARLTPPWSSLGSRSPERRVSLPNPYSAHCLGHGRGRLICYAVAAHPTADWPARQITDAFPSDTTPKYLIRDNDRALAGDSKLAYRSAKATAWRRDRNTVALSLSRDGAGSQQDTYGSVLAASGKVASGGQITSSGSQLICQRRSARALASSSLCQQAPSLRVRITRRQRAIALAMLRRTKASLRHGIAVAAWPKL